MSQQYEQISAKFWSLPQKPKEETRRDELFMDDQILHAHLEKEIARHLEGVRTVLDAGGGSGRFSIWLAKQGYMVTHLDISAPMLEMAKEKAAQAGVLEKMTFVQGQLTELSAYRDGEFDLVISFDAPVSYTYPKHHEVISELGRIAGVAMVLCVSGRLGSYPSQFNPAAKKPYLVDETDPDTANRWYVWEWEQRDKWTPEFDRADRLIAEGLTCDPEEVLAQMLGGGTPWPVTYHFRPEELAASLAAAGLQEVRLSGPGALARTLPGDILRKLLYTEEYREPFLMRCFLFDSEPSVCGLGLYSLVASGRKQV